MHVVQDVTFHQRTISTKSDPFIIAEMSGNHNNSLERALEIVDQVAKSGADAIKLQTYTADSMTLNSNKPEFLINNEASLWHGRQLYDLYTQAATPWEWHAPIFERAKAQGLMAFSSAFDKTAVDFLESLDVPLYKIASFENIDLPLIRYVAQTGKPIILSTGLASQEEIAEAVACARSNGCQQLILLKCTSAYPATAKHANLKTMVDIAKQHDCLVGLSDHTLGIGVAIASVALGASVIEKHVTLARDDGGVDSAFSLEPHELAQLVTECRNAKQAIGEVQYGPTEHERDSLIFRRSIYFAKDIKAGEVIDAETISIIRPGYGLAPKHYDSLLGKKVNQDVEAATAVNWDVIENA